ncbi:SDR family oxidoreductase [Nocardioides sp. BGMRC 2183]|nr:SDR family oxidoreductase [Nocardioides sp. BGMRC 2183]
MSADDRQRRVAVVTGGASGIGYALAARFAADGMDVALGDIEAAALEVAVARLADQAPGVRVLGVRTDVSSRADVDALMGAAVDAFDRIDMVCANAGVETGGRFLDVDETAWRWLMDVNYFGALHTAQAALPALERSGDGHLVFTGSLASFATGTPFMMPYCATKMAVLAVAESLEIELRASGSNVHVHLLAPGPVQSRMIDAERNAPAGVTINEDGARREAMECFRARQSAHGLPAEDVAALVAEAVATDSFYVLPHPDSATAALERRLAWMRTGEAPPVRVAGS